MREYQVRICERLGVKFPGPTRQTLPSRTAAGSVRFSQDRSFPRAENGHCQPIDRNAQVNSTGQRNTSNLSG